MKVTLDEELEPTEFGKILLALKLKWGIDAFDSVPLDAVALYSSPEDTEIIESMLTELFYIEDASDRENWCQEVLQYIHSLNPDYVDTKLKSCTTNEFSKTDPELFMTLMNVLPRANDLDTDVVSLYFQLNTSYAKAKEVIKKASLRRKKIALSCVVEGSIKQGSYRKAVTVSFGTYCQNIWKRAEEEVYAFENYIVFGRRNVTLAYGKWVTPDHMVLDLDYGSDVCGDSMCPTVEELWESQAKQTIHSDDQGADLNTKVSNDLSRTTPRSEPDAWIVRLSEPTTLRA